MTIKRENIDRRVVDFSDVACGSRLPPVHPKVPRSRANDIVLGRPAITTDTAMRLGRYFGMSPEFWIICRLYDLDVADRTVRRKIEQEVAPRNAA
jgi:plasmid maintenance system antidote protein VapI